MAVSSFQDELLHWREANAKKLASASVRPGLTGESLERRLRGA